MSLLYRLVLIFCGLSIAYATSFEEDYCDLSLCSKGKHVACDNDLKQYDKNCKTDAELLEIPDKLRDGIVLRINELRNQLAGGGFSGFTPADRMATVQWDTELAYLAKFNVIKCTLKRDSCRNTRNYGHVGQTISYRGYRKRIPRLDTVVLKQINTWFNEHEISSMTDIFAYKGPTHGKFKRNFLQIAMENNDRIGCALLQQTQNEWLQTFLTCNYGNAPVVSKAVYTSGGLAASRCKSGKNPSFSNLCSIHEVYGKDDINEDETEFETHQSNATSSTAKASPKNVTETVNDTTTKLTEKESTEKSANSTTGNKETSDGSSKSRTFKISPRTQTANKTESSDTVATNKTESSVSLPTNETATQPTVQANSTKISTTLSTIQSSTETTPTTTETAKPTTPKPSEEERKKLLQRLKKIKNYFFYRFIRLIEKLHALAKNYKIIIKTDNQEVEQNTQNLSTLNKTRTENISSRLKHVGDALQKRQLRMRSRGIRGRTMKQKHKLMSRTRRNHQDLSDGLVKWRTI